MLKVDLRQANVAGAAQSHNAHTLRERPLDAGALTVLGGEHLLRLMRPGGLQRGMLLARAQCEQTPGRVGAAWLEGAHLAIRAREAGAYHHPPPTLVGGPALARMARRTGRDLSVPVEPEVLEREGARRSGLPLLVLRRWPYEPHAVVTSAGQQVFRIHVPGVHQMRARQQILGSQCPVHLLESVTVRDRRRRGLDVGDEMRPPLVAGFRHVHLVADPDGRALLGEMHVRIVRRS